jgi:hypothetical protein
MQGVMPRAEALCWVLSTLVMGMPKGFVSLYEGIVIEFPVFYTSSTLIWGLKSKNSFVVLERKKTCLVAKNRLWNLIENFMVLIPCPTLVSSAILSFM